MSFHRCTETQLFSVFNAVLETDYKMFDFLPQSRWLRWF